MNEHIAEIKFIQLTSEMLMNFISTVQSRIVIAKAGYFTSETTHLINIVTEKNIDCTLYLETGENAIRYGFGEQDALHLISENADLLNVQSANQIRMAFIIIDDTVLAYSPIALSWEEIPKKPEFPNGILGGKEFANSLLQQIGGKVITLPIEEQANITISVPPIPVKTTAEVKKEIDETSKLLKENPPVDPAILRKTNLYRSKFKLLKMIVHGANINNKSLDLRPFNSIFPHTDKRLKASWIVFTSKEIKELTSIKNFQTELSKIERENTFDANRHGQLIKTEDIEWYEFSVQQLIDGLRESLCGIGGEHQQQGLFETITLNTLLNDSKNDLMGYLFTLAIKDERCWKKLFDNEYSLYKKVKNNEIDKEMAVKEAIESFVDVKLKFPDIDKLIESIDVTFDYYDVSNELLEDDHFMDMLKKYDVEIREYKNGYEIA